MRACVLPQPWPPQRRWSPCGEDAVEQVLFGAYLDLAATGADGVMSAEGLLDDPALFESPVPQAGAKAAAPSDAAPIACDDTDATSSLSLGSCLAAGSRKVLRFRPSANCSSVSIVVLLLRMFSAIWAVRLT